MLKIYLKILGIGLICCSLSACLKTRAQLKEDGDHDPQPIPAEVKDVRPEGQYIIDELKSTITQLTGRVEDLERQATTPKQDDTVKKLESRIVELEQAQAHMLEAIKKFQQPTRESPELFEKGKKEYFSGNYEAAAETLALYLKSPHAKHSEDATFYRAESLYQLKHYKKAIVDYSKFPEKFTHSKKMPVVLYKIGLSFEALGMKDDASSFFQELVEKYPKSSEAKRAKLKLK